jgi:lipopolysaccharide assembly protein A
MNFKLILSAILAGLAVIFIIQNTAVVDIRFLFWTLSMSRLLLFFFLLAIGVILGWLLHGYSMHRTKK